MENIVKESNTVIQKYKEGLEKANKNEDLEKQIEKLKQQVDSEKNQSLLEFNRYKQKCDEKEA